VDYTLLNRDELPYDGNTQEIFIIQEGIATFTVGTSSLEARAGQIVLVPSAVPHKFVNLSERPLKQIDIHVSKQLITHRLED
jgi:mannose-6-phosphate isomerase-like protein (cupin superfamily)